MATPSRKPLFNFDPTSTLGWSVPLILFAPFLFFALTVFSVRYRRSASNVALFAFFVTLATTLLVAWAEFNKVKPYTATFPYLSLSLTFTGATRFQNFQLDLGFRIDHLALACLTMVMIVGFACVAWHRVGGRDEQGPVRFHAAMLLLAFAAAGVIVSADLTELLAFWGIAGAASYLLAAHRWGRPGLGGIPGGGGQLALWLPLAGDVSLLLGLGLLWSRYGGPLNVERLVPILRSTPGAGLKNLTTACLLVLFAAVLRAGVAPFHAWCVGSRDAPPAGLAFMQAVWPLLSGLLLYRTIPLFLSAGPQVLRAGAIGLTACIGLSLVLTFVGNDVRRAVSLPGAAAAGLLLLGLWQPASGLGRGIVGLTAASALAGLLALGPGRAAVMLAVSSMSGPMRSYSLGDFGAGWARMAMSTLTLVLGSVSVSLAPGTCAALLGAGHRQWIFGVALAGVALALWRVYVLAGHAPLRPRRAFEPARVREVGGWMVFGGLVCGLLGVFATLLLLADFALGPVGGAAGVALLTRWLDFLEGARHATPPVQTLVLWVLPAVAGAFAGAAAYTMAREPLLRLGNRFGGWFREGYGLVLDVLGRFVGSPSADIADRIEVDGVGEVEAGVGGAVGRIGALRLDRVPPLGLAVLVGVLGAVVVALLSPGIHR